MIEQVEREPPRIYSPDIARAMLRRESQRTVLADRMRRLWLDSELEKRRAGGLSLSIGLSLGMSSGPSGFTGSFATLLPGAWSAWQANLGLTYGPTLLAGGGATDAVARTGTLATAPVPILAKGTGAGVCSIYYDGGTTPAMTGVTPSAGVPIALTGAALGISLAWTSATIALNNTWTATCAGLADQTTNGKNATQGTSSKQPIVTPGSNGKTAVLLDGVDDLLTSSVGSLFVSTEQIVIVCRRVTTTGTQALCGGDNNSGVIYNNGSGTLVQTFNGSAGPSLTYAGTGFTRFYAALTSSAGDVLKAGNVSTAGSAGSISGTNRTLGCNGSGQFGNIELLFAAYLPANYVFPFAAFDAALNSAAGYGVASISV